MNRHASGSATTQNKEIAMNTRTLPVTDTTRRSCDAAALELAWTLVENQHSINKKIERGVIFEFPQWMAAEEFSTAIINYINTCTNHSATQVEECNTDKSYEWATTKPGPGMPTPVDVYLPTIAIAFSNSLRVDGLVVTDTNGKPIGIIVTDCDDKKRDKWLGTFIRI